MKALFITIACTFSFAAQAADRDKCLNFNLYPTLQIFEGSPAIPKIQKATPAYRYRTTIKEEGYGPPNFAGHLRVVTWGCGTGCHELALVDVITGKSWRINAPPASTGFEHYVESNLLVFDSRTVFPEWRVGDLTAFEFKSASYVWDELTKTLKKIPDCNGVAQQGVPEDALKQRASER
jgi:hypothetical protein